MKDIDKQEQEELKREEIENKKHNEPIDPELYDLVYD